MTARIESALAFIPASDRDVWLNMAMAVKHELGDAGFSLWDEWSQSATNYNAASAKSVWKSCKGTGITVGTLFHEAKLNGWIDNDKHAKPTRDQLEARQREAKDRATHDGIEREKAQQAAAKKAGWIMHQTKMEPHAYLDSKGWKDVPGAVWWPNEEQNLLCIPLRVGDALVGLQLIDRNGEKKFLTGQRTSGAEYLISNNGRGASDFWVEGYASALSLRACLSALRMRYRIHVTFSANNLQRMAHSGFVIADNDASQTGEKAAQATGLPYWMPEATGTDINDYHKDNGTFRASQALRKWLQEVRQEASTT